MSESERPVPPVTPAPWHRQAAAALLAAAFAELAGTAEAIPAYGRRYGVTCATCHAPLPPRLNNLGILFRRAGLRMPDSDDEGRLLFKTVPPRASETPLP